MIAVSVSPLSICHQLPSWLRLCSCLYTEAKLCCHPWIVPANSTFVSVNLFLSPSHYCRVINLNMGGKCQQNVITYSHALYLERFCKHIIVGLPPVCVRYSILQWQYSCIIRLTTVHLSTKQILATDAGVKIPNMLNICQSASKGASEAETLTFWLSSALTSNIRWWW